MEGNSGLEDDEDPTASGNDMSPSYINSFARKIMDDTISRNMLPKIMSPSNGMAPRNVPQRNMSPMNNMEPINHLLPMYGMVPGNGMLPDMYTANDMPPMNMAYMNNMTPRSMTPMDGVPLMNNMSTMDQRTQDNWIQGKMARRARGNPSAGMQNWQS